MNESVDLKSNKLFGFSNLEMVIIRTIQSLDLFKGGSGMLPWSSHFQVTIATLLFTINKWCKASKSQ